MESPTIRGGNPDQQDVETPSVGGSYTYQAATDLTEIAG